MPCSVVSKNSSRDRVAVLPVVNCSTGIGMPASLVSEYSAARCRVIWVGLNWTGNWEGRPREASTAAACTTSTTAWVRVIAALLRRRSGGGARERWATPGRGAS